MSDWFVSDDAVGLETTRKELTVRNSNIGILIEYTGYTGEFSAAGRKLASKLCALLNEVDSHACRTYAGQEPNGYPLLNLTLKAARARVKALGFKGREAEAIAREIAGRKA